MATFRRTTFRRTFAHETLLLFSVVLTLSGCGGERVESGDRASRLATQPLFQDLSGAQHTDISRKYNPPVRRIVVATRTILNARPQPRNRQSQRISGSLQLVVSSAKLPESRTNRELLLWPGMSGTLQLPGMEPAHIRATEQAGRWRVWVRTDDQERATSVDLPLGSSLWVLPKSKKENWAVALKLSAIR